MSNQYVLGAQKSNHSLGCIERSAAIRSRKTIVLPCSALIRPHPGYCIQLWGPLYKKDMSLLECVWRRVMKMIKGLDHLSCEESVRELALFSPDKRRLQGYCFAAFPYTKGASNKDGDFLLWPIVTAQGAIALN